MDSKNSMMMMRDLHYDHDYEKVKVKKGAWTPEEDSKLVAYINRYGIWNWNEMSKAAGLSRSGKSCRLRWMNYLRPDIKRGNFSKEEDETVLTLHEMLGNKWSAIAAKIPGRTDNEIKNHWHTHLKKRLRNNYGVQESKLEGLEKSQVQDPELKNYSSFSTATLNALHSEGSNGVTSLTSSEFSCSGLSSSCPSILGNEVDKEQTIDPTWVDGESINWAMTNPIWLEESVYNSCTFDNDEAENDLFEYSPLWQ